jgi:hypothetical protein
VDKISGAGFGGKVVIHLGEHVEVSVTLYKFRGCTNEETLVL